MAAPSRKPTVVRQHEIAEAALRVIDMQGATSLTAATVAAEVGLTSGAIFRHFATVDDVLVAAVDLAIESVERTFPDAELPPTARLRSLALERIKCIGDGPGLRWLLLSDQVYLSVPEEAVARLRDLVRRSRKYILNAIRDGIAQGELRNDFAPEAMLPIFTGTIHSLIDARGVHETATKRARSTKAETVVDALLSMWARPDGQNPSRTENES
jgi:AcrR family transcriptional regulator